MQAPLTDPCTMPAIINTAPFPSFFFLKEVGMGEVVKKKNIKILFKVLCLVFIVA